MIAFPSCCLLPLSVCSHHAYPVPKQLVVTRALCGLDWHNCKSTSINNIYSIVTHQKGSSPVPLLFAGIRSHWTMCSGTVRSELLPYSFHDSPDCSIWVQPIRAAAGTDSTVPLVHVLVQHVSFFKRNEHLPCCHSV